MNANEIVKYGETIRAELVEKLFQGKEPFEMTDERVCSIIKSLGGEITTVELNLRNCKAEIHPDGKFTLHCMKYASAEHKSEMLGLYLLKKDNIPAGSNKIYMATDPDTTKEVKTFSEGFLLPKEAFCNSVANHSVNGVCNFFLVADDFGVDCTIVRTRGGNLQMWDYKSAEFGFSAVVGVTGKSGRKGDKRLADKKTSIRKQTNLGPRSANWNNGGTPVVTTGEIKPT